MTDSGYSLTDEGLPLAGGPAVTSNDSIGLKTELSMKRRQDFPNVRAITGEELALQESLDEELGVEGAGSGVKRSSLHITIKHWLES